MVCSHQGKPSPFGEGAAGFAGTQKKKNTHTLLLPAQGEKGGWKKKPLYLPRCKQKKKKKKESSFLLS